jgi:hypothetical protein
MRTSGDYSGSANPAATTIRPSLLFLHREADELEHVELVDAVERRQRLLPHGQLGAALDRTIEADHRPASGAAASLDDGRRLAVREQRRTGLEDLLPRAPSLDEERAVEAVRLPHAPDTDELTVHGL